LDVTRALVNGRHEEAQRLLANEEQRAESGEIPAMVLVGQAVRRGGNNLALKWLERAYENHDYWLLFINVDPEMDSLRSDPRFQAVVKQLAVQ